MKVPATIRRGVGFLSLRRARGCSEECRLARNAALRSAVIVALLAHFLSSQAAAQALLYDNTDHTWARLHEGPRNVIWAGFSQPGEWYEAQAFDMGAHNNIASVTIPMGRTITTARGTIRVSLWDDNGRGFPGEEVAELGVVDIDTVTRISRDTPSISPAVTFDTLIDDLVPGETYFVLLDYHDLTSFQYGNLVVGLSTTAGAGRIPSELYGDNFPTPPFEDRDWITAASVFGQHRFLQMQVTSADDPYLALPCGVDTVYHQDFRSLGEDGERTAFMPLGWAFSDMARHAAFDGRELSDEERLLAVDERIFNTSITEAFPASRSLGTGTSVYNAGVPGDPDRALALGIPSSSGDAMLQLVTQVIGGDADSVQLSFDIEAWDSAASRDNPGEAAFKVVLDLDTGSGFEQLLDLGTITTGARLEPSRDDFVDGNDDAYRTSFDSGLRDIHLPEGSKLRVRWMADLDAKTRGWVFGLDNVSLGMFADVTDGSANFVRGDCNNDGGVDISDATCGLNWLFAGALDVGCLAALNVNADDTVDIADAVYSLNFLFAGGAAPVAPYPDCGPATLSADEALGCANPTDCQ